MRIRRILTHLLDGQFICQTTEPTLFTALQSETTHDIVNTTLSTLGYELRGTLQPAPEEEQEISGMAYYAAYADYDDKQDQQKILKQCQDLRDQVSPIMDFILLLMRTQGKDGVFLEGDTLRFSELLSAIENESTYQAELKTISHYPLFNNRKVEKNHDRLNMVLTTLEKEGYITLKNKESMIYQFCGKISHFYNTISFILEHEDIPINEDGILTDDTPELNL
ncbi:MAG: hypothetical protein HOM11_10735 [Methylococcales bacterium]|jgi:hypothetical protein|nr:hypothetical protein [Methylococcales bacterium]MBT7444479.1 hypothetical protein [Methylococcales bacterium]